MTKATVFNQDNREIPVPAGAVIHAAERLYGDGELIRYFAACSGRPEPAMADLRGQVTCEQCKLAKGWW